MANDKKEEKSIQQQINEAVRAALSQQDSSLVEKIATAMVQAQAMVKISDTAASEAFRLTGEKCQGCQQILPRGCKQGEHKHKSLVVWSDYNPEYFPGVRINGVQYLSNNSSHRVLVPEDANVEYAIEQWRQNEIVTAQGRKFNHDSGSTKSFKPANSAFR